MESAAKSVLKVQQVWSGAKSSEFPESDRVDGSILLLDKRRAGSMLHLRPYCSALRDLACPVYR